MSRSAATTLTKYFGMAITANVMVGILPIYWALFSSTNCYLILFHRCLWSALFLLPFLFLRFDIKQIFTSLKQNLPFLLLSTCFLGINWFTYLYSIHHQHVLEASLAYFIAPLINIFLGALFLKEKLSSRQKIAIIFAAASILFLLVVKGIFPKFGLIIAFSFSFYSLMGRRIQASTLLRIYFESLSLFVLFLIFYHPETSSISHFCDLTLVQQLFFILTGPLTVIPSLMQNKAIRHLPFATIGILGFIVPTLIFSVGILYFHEKLDGAKFYTILFIWLSVAIYIFDLLKRRQLSSHRNITTKS